MDLVRGYKRRRANTPPYGFAPRTRHAPPPPKAHKVRPPPFSQPQTPPMGVRDEWLHRTAHGANIPPHVYYPIESALVKLRGDKARMSGELLALRDEVALFKSGTAANTARGRKIQEHEERFRKMKQEIGQKDQEIEMLRRQNGRQGGGEDEKTIRELQDRVRAMRKEIEEKDRRMKEFLDTVEWKANGEGSKQELQDKIAEQDDKLVFQEELLKAGAKAVEQKRLENARLSQEKTALVGIAETREATINRLNSIVNKMQTASGQVMIDLALEAQAQKALPMVQGLQAQVAEQEGIITRLSADVAQHEATIAKQEKKRIEQDQAMEDLNKAAEDAHQRVTACDAIADEQMALINRMIQDRKSM